MITWTPRLVNAREYFRSAHDAINQKRKYDLSAYWTHTEAVAELVHGYGGTEDMIVAALGHDYLEDVTPLLPTTYNESVLRSMFGDVITNMIVELTDTFTKENYPHLSRKERKQGERERLAKVSKESQLIKLSDLTHNTISIVEHDPKFARTYLQEKSALLPLLRNPYTEAAWVIADAQVTSHMMQIVLNKG